MPDSSISSVALPTTVGALSSPSANRSAGLHSPAQARAYLNNLTSEQLADLVRSGRLRALRDPAGRLCFAVADLDAIPKEIAPDIAAAELTNDKDHSVVNATMAVPSQAPSFSSVRNQSADFTDILDELRRTLARSPKWVDIDDAVTLYGVPAKTIKQWASQGFVRKSKLGPTFQSKTLYNADDLNQVLCRIAVGKSPIVALGREH